MIRYIKAKEKEVCLTPRLITVVTRYMRLLLTRIEYKSRTRFRVGEVDELF